MKYLALLLLVIGFETTVGFNSLFDDDDDDDEPRIFNYNLYLQKPYSTRVDSKSKVETLGKVLKGHIQELKSTANKEIDLIFLVDSSTSVGKNNFKEEIKFVKKLLSDFTVDVNHTRVVVITFSSRGRVIRHVDYFSNNNEDKHKCSLLEEDLKKISYSGGGTFTLGAFLEAKKVLKNARSTASKAIFLVTDGFSNGGDPRPEARTLRTNGVRIFTFGIQNGNVRELYDMASNPKNESTYILDSFEEFEALAKRALHEDLTTGRYIVQPAKKCDRLCVGKDCCDLVATCNCGTHTGKYECMCPAGYFGNGLRTGGCQACPSGTYKPEKKTGDVYTCTKCPDENHVTEPGATSIHQCVCRKGYRNFNGTGCAVLKCPALVVPKDGYFVNDKCKNVFNAACGLRCKPGYELRGSSLRICQEDGKWSGTQTQCIMKTCPALMIPKNGNMICTTDDFSFNTVCRFTCDTGYKLVGSRKRTCLAIAYWTGINTRCREITCRPLPIVRDGSVNPPACTAGDVAFGTTCSVTCHPGYSLIGPHSKQCLPEGVWTPASDVSRCVDTSAPFIMCPYNIEAETDLNENTATVSWLVPLAVDNSGYVPILSSIPAVMPPEKFPIGKTKVTYIAEDLNKNRADCHFYIIVKDKQPPTIDRCFSPLPIVSPEPYADVNWEEPMFSDNSGRDVRIRRSHAPGLFPKGKTEVVYTAYDDSGNNRTCVLKINVIPHPCEYPPAPLNGNRTCFEDSDGVVCTFACNEGYEFAIKPANEYRCAFDNVWEPKRRMPVSDCSALQKAYDIIQPASFTYAGLVACTRRLELTRLEKDFEQRVIKRVNQLCEEGVDCSIQDLETTCEPKDGSGLRIVLGREKRSITALLRQRRETTSFETEEALITFDYLIAGKAKHDDDTDDDGPDQSKVLNIIDNIKTSLEKDAKKGHLDLEVNGKVLALQDMKFDDTPTYLCEPGSVLVENSCAKCPVGSFFNVVSEQCESCPKGTFQPVPGQKSCLYCPTNTSTPGVHATSEVNCQALCLPGTFSYNGLEMCETCRRGYYQGKYGQTDCERCPKGHTTIRRGMWTIQDCKEKCPEGHVSPTGLQPCWPCPTGTYQSKGGKSSCIKCPLGSHTSRKGSTDLTDCEFELADGPPPLLDILGTDDQQAIVEANQCFGEPCSNGATCKPDPPFSFECICARGYTGVFCDEEIDECEGAPCLNGGTCTDLLDDFKCACPRGFSGKKCETNMNDCVPQPCQNSGTCIDLVDGFSCVCENGYTGDKCEINIDECENQPCLNGGTCLDGVASYTCVCPDGIKGDQCEINDDNCASGPCVNDAECMDDMGTFKCMCPKGFEGVQCEIDIDDCKDNPCADGSKCEDLPGGYKCHCPTGTTGPDCKSEIDIYFQLDFPATASTTDYARVKMGQDLTSATVCFWMKSSDEKNQGTPFSYANKDGDNIFTLTDYDGFVFYVNGEKITTTIRGNDGNWHHVCVLWSNNRGSWKFYMDGVPLDSGRNLANGQVVKGGGEFVIGQEQDSVGGGFSSAETFIGQITQLNLWSKEISLQEIEDQRQSCTKQMGDVIAWSDIAGKPQGAVTDSPVEFCKECPEPKHIDYGETKSNGRTAGSIAEYSCNRGFTLAGRLNRLCLVTGEWEGKEPTCARVQCNVPDPIDNGWIDGDQYTFDNRIRYSCQRGYKLIGSPTRYCGEFGFWEEDPPKCEQITCKIPLLTENTILKNPKPDNKFNPGEDAFFECKPGHNMYTDHSSVYCQRDGTWDLSIPTCDPQTCKEPPEIPNGRFSNPNGKNEYAVGFSAQYECQFGYHISLNSINPEGKIDCLPSGLWEADLPECVIVTCPDPSPIANGVYEKSGNLYLNQARYSCNKGFELSHSEILECYENGEWSRAPPECIPVRCGRPEDILHGTFEGEEFTYKGIVTYKCDLGYKIVGIAVRECLENTSWSGSTPACKPISCGKPSSPEHGSYVGRDFTLNNEIRYVCDNGYERIGAEKSVCRETGKWQNGPPVCQKVECGTPETISNGFYEGASFYFEDVITYKCDSGFYLDGVDTLTCLGNKQWSSAVPQCLIIQCPKPVSVDNAFYENPLNLESFDVGSRIRYQCNIGFQISLNSLNPSGEMDCLETGQWEANLPECLPVKCRRPQPILNGNTVLSSLEREYKSFVRYICNSGYDLVGTNTLTCEADGTWSDEPPVCQAIECQEPNVILNGQLNYKDLKLGSVVQYQCNEGYELSGLAIRRCLANLTWSGADPSCQKIDCGVPSPVNNSRIEYDDTLFQATATYTCDVGYFIVGDSNRVCNKDRQWSGSAPACQIVACVKPSEIISNGRLIGTDFTYGSVIRYECDPGYVLLDGLDTRTCLASGEWDRPIPTCSAVECSKLDVKYGFVSGFQREYGVTHNITCRAGYRLEGDSVRTCQADGTWSGEQTRCVKFQCPRLESPVNGQVLVRGLSASYICLNGYVLKGPSRRTCESNDQWSLTAPTCEPIECPDLAGINFENGQMTYDNLQYGSSVLFECNVGYLLEGAPTIDCQQDGTWSGSIPVCKKKTCYPPFAPPNAKIIGEERSFGDTILYQCDEGYKINGDVERTCTADGSWSGLAPNCEYIFCPVPKPNINVIVSGTSYSYGNKLEYKCNDGYVIDGPVERTCTESGEWSGEEPVCRRNECPRPGPFRNGRAQAAGFGIGDSLTYECNEGYTIRGSTVRACLPSLQWSGSEPVCEKVQCQLPPPLENGNFDGEEFYFGDVITYTCNDGYEIAGEARRRCLSVGKWSGADTHCIRKSCGPPPLPRNAKFTLSNGETEGTFETEATLSCEEGFIGKGERVQRCESSGKWSEINFECKIVTCPEFTDVSNALLSGVGNQFGNSIEIICDEGYYIVGKSRIVCQSNGEWDYEVTPYCEERGCPDLPPLSNGYADSKQTSVGSVVTQQCNDGYKLHGSGRRICEKGGFWSGSEPYCRLISCEQPPFVKNALPINAQTQYYHKSKVTYTCKTGYTITAGDATLTCSDDEKWEGEIPTCSPLQCGEPVEIPNSKVAVASYSYQGEAQYLCYLGYRVKGSATIRCDENGKWSGALPSCVLIDCGEPPKVSNSKVLGTSRTTFNTTISYECQLGFRLVGQKSTTCRATGVWSGTPPLCEPVQCGPPPEILNAFYIGNEFQFRSIITYQCVDGYEMSGHPSLECAYDGAWIGARPTCELQTCGPPPVLPHSSTTVTNNARIGSILTHVCNDGFYLVGSAVAKCEKSKQWEYDGDSPRCERKDCGVPPYISHGIRQYTDTFFESVVSYQCEEGYVVGSSTELRCGNSGAWEGDMPVCLPMYCGEPPRGRGPEHLTVIGDNYFFGSIVEFKCEKGYELVGPSNAECTQTGQWSDGPPNCDEIRCVPLPLPNFGSVIGGESKSEYYSGDRVVIGCKEGYDLIGDAVLECTDTGLWSSDSLRCQPAKGTLICDPETGFPHVRPFNDAAPAGWTEILQCDVGYTPVGDLSTECLEDGTWRKPSGKCTRVSCGKPRLRDFVNVVRIRGSSYLYGDKITFRCRAGVAPARSPPVITCLSSGNWDGDIACGVTCKRTCQNGGICLGLNRCKCPPGYSGSVCQKAICILPCLNGGKCTSPYQCSCPAGYEGVRCQNPICQKPCQHGGRCIKPNRCRCSYMYKGTFCETKKF